MKNNIESSQDEIEKECAAIALKYQDRIDNEASYLYFKILNWRKKYNNYPTRTKILVMIAQIKIDLHRKNTKYRLNKDGTKIGNGKYIKEYLNIDGFLPRSMQRNDSDIPYVKDVIKDNNILPSEFCEYNFDELTKCLDNRERFIVVNNFLGEYKTEIGKKLNLSSERVNQILVNSLIKIKESIGHEL